MQSGTALCIWSVGRSYRSVIQATGIALGVITGNTTKLIKGLKKISSTRLHIASVLAMSAVSNINNKMLSQKNLNIAVKFLFLFIVLGSREGSDKQFSIRSGY